METVPRKIAQASAVALRSRMHAEYVEVTVRAATANAATTTRVGHAGVMVRDALAQAKTGARFVRRV